MPPSDLHAVDVAPLGELADPHITVRLAVAAEAAGRDGRPERTRRGARGVEREAWSARRGAWTRDLVALDSARRCTVGRQDAEASPEAEEAEDPQGLTSGPAIVLFRRSIDKPGRLASATFRVTPPAASATVSPR
jgi:hypothetical protein